MKLDFRNSSFNVPVNNNSRRGVEGNRVKRRELFHPLTSVIRTHVADCERL